MSRLLYARLNRRFGRRPDGLSRREMLKASLATAGSYMLSESGVSHAQGTSSARRVVVIGAGFSGLACAYELAQAKYDVTVVEARNRLGGRVLSFSDFIKGRNVEGGAELIGSNHPTWVAYARQFHLEFLDVFEDKDAEAPIVIDGRRLSAEESEKLWKELEEPQARMSAVAEPVNADEPWKSHDAEALDRRSTAEWLAGLKLSDLCRKGFAAQLAANNGVELKNQSLLGNLTSVKGGGLEKYWTDSEVYRCKGGNQQLAMRLADAIGSGKIVLKLAAKEVSCTEKGAVVKCADGRTIECDDVVLSVPPNVWPKIQFSPDLPRALRPQMGSNVKYLAHLRKPVWKVKETAADSLTNGTVSMTWNGTDGQGGDDNVCLVAFSGGDAAERCRSHASDADAFYKPELDKLYPEFSREFVASRFMNWPSDPWVMAAYSFPAPGQVTTVGPLMRQGQGRLHFCGEHTCYKFVGYMEGALNSGAALARRLAVRDGVVKG